MNLATRTEFINGTHYCAYCGKPLNHSYITISPKPPLLCNCEKAMEERDLWHKLEELYKSPLADDLIEIKVDTYRRQLRGEADSYVYINGGLTCTSGTCMPVSITTSESTTINCADDGEK